MMLVIIGLVLLLMAAGVWGYIQGVRKDKPYESGIDSERFDARERSSFSSVQSSTSLSTPAPPSGMETVPYAEARESVLPPTVPTRKPRPAATRDWNDTSSTAVVAQPFFVQDSSYDSGGSSYSGDGGASD